MDVHKTYTVREYRWNLKIVNILHGINWFCYFILLIMFVKAIHDNVSQPYPIVGILFIAIIDYLLYKWVKTWEKDTDSIARKNENTWGNGAAAELMVQTALESLPNECRFVYDFKKENGGNIDFIIVSPQGLFAIEVKAKDGLINYRQGRLFSFNEPFSKDHDPIRQSLGNAVYLSDLLNKQFGKRYMVQGILVFPRGQIDLKTIHGQIMRVWIGGQDFFKYAMKKSDNHLTAQEVENITNFLIKERVRLRD